MRNLKFLLQKEFRQIFRNKAILRLIFIVPIIQLSVLPWAADYEVKRIRLIVVDQDHSSYSQKMISKITSSGYFLLKYYTGSYGEALEYIAKDKADLILEIPDDFEKRLVKEDEAQLFMAIDAVNGVKANLGGAYLRTIIQNFNREIRTEWIQYPRLNPEPNIEVTFSNWFNPLLNYKYFMVPAILVIIVTLVGSFLSTINIVKEKEIGTIEQINVTPIKKYEFILGKLVPFWILGMVVFSICLLISWLVYSVVPKGSLFTMYVFTAVYLLAVLGIGLLISTYTSNQLQAMLISFFVMIVFVLLGGIYTTIDSMPGWARIITRINPITYFAEVMRMVVLKGSSLSDISSQIFTMLGFGIVFNTLAVIMYRKRS